MIHNARNEVRNEEGWGVIILIAVVLLAVAVMAEAQQPKVYRVGVLLPSALGSEIVDGLRAGLKELGLEQGKQFVLEIRDTRRFEGGRGGGEESRTRKSQSDIYNPHLRHHSSKASDDRHPHRLLRRDWTRLFSGSWRASPNRGRLTGVYEPGTDITAKRLEILREIIPKLRRVLAFYDPRNHVASESARLAREEIARLRGVEFVERHFASVKELQASIRAVKAGEVDAFFQLSDSMVNNQAQLIIDTARDKRLPTMFLDQNSVVQGGLASYAVSFHEPGRLAAKYVQRILLAGVKPKDLPVQGVDKIDLVINLKTAKQIGLTIPQWVLYRADKVIKEASAKAGGR
jgi:putative ABC transport system substrate-binding protein